MSVLGVRHQYGSLAVTLSVPCRKTWFCAVTVEYSVPHNKVLFGRLAVTLYPGVVPVVLLVPVYIVYTNSMVLCYTGLPRYLYSIVVRYEYAGMPSYLL